MRQDFLDSYFILLQSPNRRELSFSSFDTGSPPQLPLLPRSFVNNSWIIYDPYFRSITVVLLLLVINSGQTSISLTSTRVPVYQLFTVNTPNLGPTDWDLRHKIGNTIFRPYTHQQRGPVTETTPDRYRSLPPMTQDRNVFPGSSETISSQTEPKSRKDKDRVTFWWLTITRLPPKLRD